MHQEAGLAPRAGPWLARLPALASAAVSSMRLARVSGRLARAIQHRMLRRAEGGKPSQCGREPGWRAKAAPRSSGTSKFSATSSTVQVPVRCAASTAGQPGGRHTAGGGQLCHASLVVARPHAAGPARRKPLHAALAVECPLRAVDPPVAQGLLNRCIIPHWPSSLCAASMRPARRHRCWRGGRPARTATGVASPYAPVPAPHAASLSVPAGAARCSGGTAAAEAAPAAVAAAAAAPAVAAASGRSR